MENSGVAAKEKILHIIYSEKYSVQIYITILVRTILGPTGMHGLNNVKDNIDNYIFSSYNTPPPPS